MVIKAHITLLTHHLPVGIVLAHYIIMWERILLQLVMLVIGVEHLRRENRPE